MSSLKIPSDGSNFRESMKSLKNDVAMRARTFLVHAVVIMLWASFFNALPRLLTGIPLEDQLSWDAKAFVNHWHRLLDPQIFAADATLSRTLPANEEIFLGFLARLGNALGLNMFQWSIGLSWAVLFLFLGGLYTVSYQATRMPSVALLVTLAGVIPVKVLGAGKFGLMTLGFVPQSLAFSCSLFLILVYFAAVQQKKQAFFFTFFFTCGVLANFYPALFFHMIAAFLLAEVFRQGKLGAGVFLNLVAALTGAAPVLFYVLTDFNPPAVVDVGILHERYHYLTVYPLRLRSLYYLRTFIIYALLFALMLPHIKKWMTREEHDRISPWFALGKSSLLICLVGLSLDSLPVYKKYLFSRTSLWFVLSLMILTPTYFFLLFRQRQFSRPLWVALACSSLIFLWQSDLIPISLKLRQSYLRRSDRESFLTAVRTLKGISQNGDQVLAPSEPSAYLAEDVRTYALRPVYVAYQDGAISILDGEKARFWFDRYQRQLELFRQKDPKRLIDFLTREKIDYALIPKESFFKNDLLDRHTLRQVGNYLIVRRAL